MTMVEATDGRGATRKTGRSVAVVGGGFGGVGAAVMLRRAGLRRRDRVRARRARRRRLAPQHLSRAPPATSRRTSTSSPSRPTRAGRAATRRRPRSRPTWRTSRGATACSTASAPAPRSQSARWDEERGRWVLETSAGRLRGRRPAHRLRPALVPERAARSRASTTSPARPSTPRAGATTSTWPASASPSSARAAARSRSCPRSSRSPRTSTSTSARRAGRSRRWTSPTASARRRLFERFPLLQRLDRAVDLRLPGVRRRRR